MVNSMATDSDAAARFTEQERERLRDRAVGGDTYARKLLVSDAMGLVHKAALRYQPIPDAEYNELVQVGVLALQACVERWRPSRVAFSTFAFGRVRGAMCRHHARRCPREVLTELDGFVDESDAAERYETAEAIDQLWSLISELPDRQREVMTCRMRGVDLVRICEIHGVSPERARQIEATAIRRLRVAMCAGASL